ncbi:MAG: hypothetical protein Q7Q73_07435 [Verrucomicrobiota bacterium JB024]|nr:hypothetical protein [Verrucomicrobiota bacterium JB024]
MTPYEQAKSLYDVGYRHRGFEEDFGVHLAHGYVLVTPEVFIMARPVWHKAAREAICNPYYVFPEAVRDCWHIYCMAGDVSKCWDYDPLPDLPFVSWERRNEFIGPLRMDQIKRIAKGTHEGH